MGETYVPNKPTVPNTQMDRRQQLFIVSLHLYIQYKIHAYIIQNVHYKEVRVRLWSSTNDARVHVLTN